MKSKFKQFLKNNRSLFLLILGMLFFRTAVADWSFVPSGSMEPTFYDGDYVLVDKMSYGPTIPFTDYRLAIFGSPERGDIITFYPPHTDEQYVKRVIGIPGDVLRIDGLSVIVNGEKLPFQLESQTESKFIGRETIDARQHLLQVTATAGLPSLDGEILVPEKKYFVMGDHRNSSYDSRYWGFVDENKIMGKVTHVAISFSSERPWKSRLAIQVD